MKILLLGEFSGLHKNLQEGLAALGFCAHVASKGDGWKEIPSNIIMPKMKGGDLLSRTRYWNDLYRFMDQIEGYDIVQIINPFILPFKYFPKYSLIKKIKNKNDKLFLLAAGSDAYYWKYGRKKLRYGPFDDVLRYDVCKKTYFMEKKKAFEYNKYVADLCDGIIPIMYEYQLSYEGHYNLKDIIQIPINVDKVKYSINNVNKKLVIFHGLNRYGFKGTKYVEDAFLRIKKRYGDDVQLIIDGQMSFEKYISIINKANIVIDQTNSYSCGLNALYSMAIGKVVLGGAEPESLTALGIESSPVINILPDPDDIVKKIETIISNKKSIEVISVNSRDYIEKNHDYKKIADMYLKVWGAK